MGNTKQTVSFMVGLPSSGKSTFVNSMKKSQGKDLFVMSLDKIREELFGVHYNENVNINRLFQLALKETEVYLIKGKDIVIDMTNPSSKYRQNIIRYLKGVIKRHDLDVEFVAQIMATPFPVCCDRNTKREKETGKVVPYYVLENRYKTFTMPQKGEGFDKIFINYSQEFMDNIDDYDMNVELARLDLINQNNPHHTLTIGGHCKKCFQLLTTIVKDNNDMDYSKNELLAGILHDFGKKYCMAFKSYNGKLSNHASFHNHEHVSSYEAMFYLAKNNKTKLTKVKNKYMDLFNLTDEIVNEVVFCCNAIQYHMRMHNLDSDKSRTKFKRFLNNQRLYSFLEALHEADAKAK